MTSRPPRLFLPCAALALLVAFSAWAEEVIYLADPTRPPGIARSAPKAGAALSPRSPGVPAGMETSGSSPSSSQSARPDHRLMSIRVGSSGRALALIDGHLVAVGDRVGDATVSAIDLQGVTLRGPDGSQRLSMTPTVNKTAPGAVPAARRGSKEW